MVRASQRTMGPAENGKPDRAPATALREGVADTLERLSHLLVSHNSGEATASEPAPTGSALKHVQEAVRFLGQVAAVWADVPDGAVPPSGAGFGSTVIVEDLDHANHETFTLMAGPLLDFDAGQVSLASPIGQTLLGAEEGDVVSVQTPQRLRRLRVLHVRTLQDIIAEGRSVFAA